MELRLGSHVREYGNRIGRLTAFELEPASCRIRRFVFSANGELGPNAMNRPLSAISMVHDDGEIELVPYSEEAKIAAMPSVADLVVLTRSTRIRVNDHNSGHLVGLEVNPASRDIVTVFGHQHWWSRRLEAPAAGMDCSTPGEIRLAAAGTRAA